MDIYLFNTAKKELVVAQLFLAVLKDMKSITDGWNFSWRSHFRLPNSKAFKIVTGAGTKAARTEGLMIFQVIEGESIMAYLESARHNKGSGKDLDYVAGCLIAKLAS